MSLGRAEGKSSTTFCLSSASDTSSHLRLPNMYGKDFRIVMPDFSTFLPNRGFPAAAYSRTPLGIGVSP